MHLPRRFGCCIATVNENGIKHFPISVPYALQHPGYVTPPQAPMRAGPAKPVPSRGEEGIGYDNEFTRRNATFMAWNLMRMASMIRRSGGIPDWGNQRSEWEAGCRFDHPEVR
ncbi:MAG TPA: hypothetical protein PKC03_01630 [Dokdonella sp.]|nr:hypothetical protein [Dokdonella sp.]